MKTFALIGQSYGGTSAVSGVCRILGLPMWGTRRTSDDHELYDLTYKYVSGHSNDLVELVSKRNLIGTWGFKHVDIWRHRWYFNDIFSNLNIIFIWRDPIASATHNVEHFLISLEDVYERNKIYQQYLNWEVHPCIHMSYERLLNRTESEIKYLADFLDADYSNIHTAIDFVTGPRKYKDIKEYI